MDRSDRKQILQILQEKANNWKRSDEDAVEELLRIAAVFGSLFDCLEATWIWNEKLGATQIVFPCKWKHMFAYPPASQIFSLIQLNGKGETLLNEYCGFLKLTGHYAPRSQQPASSSYHHLEHNLDPKLLELFSWT